MWMRKLHLMKKLIFTACFAIFSSSFAWTQSKHLENANESFSQMAFKEAAEGYHRCLEKDPENTFLMRRIADCALNSGDFEKAIVWYQNCLQKGGFFRDDQLCLSQALIASGAYEAGMEELYSFADNHPEDPRTIAIKAQENNKGKSHKYLLKNGGSSKVGLGQTLSFEMGVNASKIGPLAKKNSMINVFQGENLLFTESGIDCAFDPVEQVFVITSIKESRKDILYDETGRPLWEMNAFDFDGVPLTENHFIKNFASSTHCVGLPRFNEESILFSSNSREGRGGFDIYELKRTNLDKALPKNLRSMNTPGDECYAHYEQGNIIFSSNAWPGSGGFDLFCLEHTALYPKAIKNSSSANEFILGISEGQAAVHAYSPYNGSKHYSALLALEEYHCLEITFELPIDEEFVIYNKRREEITKGRTENNKMAFLIRPDELLEITGSIAGTLFEFSVWTDGENPQFLSMELLKAQAIVYKAFDGQGSGIVLGEEKARLNDVFLYEDPYLFAEENTITHSLVSFDSETAQVGNLIAVKNQSGEVIHHAVVDEHHQIHIPYNSSEISGFNRFVIDQNGKASASSSLLALRMEEIQKTAKEDYFSENAAKNLLSLGEDPNEIERLVLYPKPSGTIALGNGRFVAFESAETADTSRQNQNTLSSPKTNQRVAKTNYESKSAFNLAAIYFEYNSDIVAPSALQQLIGFVEELAVNNDKRLVISAHADARGSKHFNQELSRRRAEAVALALVNLGASPDQIVLQWFGESNIINHCSDQAICSEDLHKKKGRADLKLLSNEELALEQ